MPNLYREQRAAEQFADQHRRQRDPHAEAFAHWARTPSMTQAERRQQQAEQAEAARVAKIRKFQADFPGLEVPPEWGSAPAPILTAADAEAARKAALKAALADDSLSLDEVLEYTDAFDRDETRQRVFARIHAKHDALAKEPPDIKALRAAQPNLFTPAQGPTAIIQMEWPGHNIIWLLLMDIQMKC